ncbi:MAG: hypothetical protein A2V70_08455 [Planctomycetes bacterium RBG_13_63_9]|nr:MAG: hypothetical protein A2V70_08455 [Planctomycetes bacterium RBG_13_63_9]
MQSVDLVADPATTRGLFESSAEGSMTDPTDGSTPRPSVEEPKRDRTEVVEALWREQAAEMESLRAEVEQLRAAQQTHQMQSAIRQLLHEFHLPIPEETDPHNRSIVSDRFIESLLAAKNEQAMRELVEERAALVRSLGGVNPVRTPLDGRPLSRDQYLTTDSDRLDVKAFVEAIT